MRMILTGFLAVLLLSACKGSEPADVTAPAKTDSGAAAGDTGGLKAEAIPVTTGDVEQKVFFNGSIAENSEGPNVKSDVKKDSRGKTNMVTVDVYQPFPATLPVVFRARSNQSWEQTPLVLRGKVAIEGNPQPLGEIQFVWGKDAQREAHEVTVDVMAALPTVPESILVVLRADALLMPIGTDAATVDPATATAPEPSSTIILSNPVRINFHNEPAPAVTGEAAPAATSEPAPALVEPVQPPTAPAQ